ncbi:4Fe-4S dicluster domain-containing protein [Raoultibacter massiliensis]|uniref:4Fe-4S dicluster domain-containing protein n=1 Tax=Raoultibacter massiliensis TaxID=1852371 RepID=A0ABV1JDJ3_9ACTN|nr:4Fe-4S dicluster domain-containing protein [Raoultibacter massiliensis]
MTRQGFYFDNRRCVGCRTCQVACKDKNDLAVGILFRRVDSYQVGTYPDAMLYHYASTCNHCEAPECVAVCPNQAMYVDEEDGTVQHDDSKCIGCQYCVNACPYGVPQYLEDVQLTHKCNACIELRSNGEQPACVAACPMRALEFGPIDELRAAHPDAVDEIAVLPDSDKTHPSLAIMPKGAALEADPVAVIL